jgi:hypothetical protein
MFGLMSVKKHKAEVAIVKDERDAYAANYNRTHDALIESRDERRQLTERSNGILRDKHAESQRANLAEQRVNSLLDEIAALRPDAEKYRERCRRDREHAENARVRKRAARKEAA